MKLSENRVGVGFTIVELLIVIVVIAILASISVVTYNGVQKRAKVVAVQTGLNQAHQKVQLMFESVEYPATVDNLEGGKDVDINYVKSGAGYCITASHADERVGSFFITHNNLKGSGPCPIGMWRFNGSAVDSMPSQIDGSAVGASLTSDSAGKSNHAYATSAGQYINWGDVDFDYDNFSVSVWAKSNVATPGHVTNIIGKGNWNSNNNWYIGFKSGPALSFVYGGGWSMGPSYPVSNFDAMQWNHYVGVAAPNKKELWLNGNLVASTNQTHVSVANDYNLQAGRSSYSGNAFSGSVDDVRIYDRALTIAEIKQVFESDT